MVYIEAEPDQVTIASCDEALAALNRAASGILLTQDDLVTSYE